MDINLFYISELVEKRLRGTITSEEEAKLTEWINSSVATKDFFEQLTSASFVTQALARFDQYDVDKNRSYLLDQLRQFKINQAISAEGKGTGDPDFVTGKIRKRVFKLRKRLAFAASIIGLIMLSLYVLTSNKDQRIKSREYVAAVNDIEAPDKNRAQIRLSDGTVVYLDTVKNGATIIQPGLEITKTDDGKIEYKTVSGSNGQDANASVIYNTLINPRGSKVIDIMLQDGSHVWLNAGSVITYPVVFFGNERRVEIEGEAYFEVVKNMKQPFKVMAGGTEIKVLGTHFNVNAYADENVVRTTLLEGSVQVVNSESKAMLAPGEQASSEKNGLLAVTKRVNTEEVMAWKNGTFYFDGSDIQTVMRQVARWYDVSVIYEGQKPGGHYRGKPSRSLTLSQMLKVIEYSGVKFKVDGKNVIIME